MEVPCQSSGMEASEDIELSICKKIKVVFAKNPSELWPQCRHDDTSPSLSSQDCQYIWEEVQYADKIQKLGQCFEESSKMLLQHLQDDQLTQKDKTTFLNFLCQSGAISIRMLSLHQDSPPVLPKRINPKHLGQKASTSTPAYACQTPQQSLPKSGRDWHRATEQMMSPGNSENSIQRKSFGNVMKVKTSLAKKKKPLKNHRFRINQMGKMAKRQIAKRNSASAGTRSRCEEMDISKDSSCVSLTATGIVQHVLGNSEGGSLRLQNAVQKQQREVQNLPTDVKQPESDSGSQTLAVRSNESEIHGRGTDAENWYSDSAVQCQGSESEQQSDSDAVVNCQDNAIFDSEVTVDSQQHKAPDSELNTSQCQQFDGQCQQTDGQYQQTDGRCQQADGQCQQIDGQCQQIDGQCQQTNGQSQQTNGQSQENIGLCQQKVGQNQGNVLQGQQNVAGSQPGETSGSVDAIECQENRLADSEKFTQCQEHGSTYPESFVQCHDSAFEGSASTGQCQQSSDLRVRSCTTLLRSKNQD
ncbi:uncharacterized protein [Ptychodera flava]|uniref:uncharacterized protein n=1 Tax=Ptychodera flava TaxID=63121 RepID=UPI00396A1AB6